MLKRYLGVVIALMILLASACQTIEGRTAGTVVDDTTINSTVKTKLLGDDFLKGVTIDVETFNGAVTLIGGVDTLDQKRRAGELARNVEGVREVNNLLQVK